MSYTYVQNTRGEKYLTSGKQAVVDEQNSWTLINARKKTNKVVPQALIGTTVLQSLSSWSSNLYV